MSLPADDSSLLALAGLIADGAAAAWPHAESMAAGPELEFVKELEVIAGLAAVHRAAAEAAEPSSPPDLTQRPGSTWGPLQLLRDIGSGRFGTVYVARDSARDRDVA